MNILVTDNITFMNQNIAEYYFEPSKQTVSVIILTEPNSSNIKNIGNNNSNDNICINNGSKYKGTIKDLVQLAYQHTLCFDYSDNNDSIDYEKIRSACMSIKKIKDIETVIFIVNAWQLSDTANFITSQMYILPTIFDEKYYHNLITSQKRVIRKMKFLSGRRYNPIILVGYRLFNKTRAFCKKIIS